MGVSCEEILSDHHDGILLGGLLRNTLPLLAAKGANGRVTALSLPQCVLRTP